MYFNNNYRKMETKTMNLQQFKWNKGYVQTNLVNKEYWTECAFVV